MAALLDLYEDVSLLRARGERSRHLVEPIMVRARSRAERLCVGDLLPDDADLHGHRGAELRGLAYHRAIAKGLRQPMVDEAWYLLWKWRRQGRIGRQYAERWEALLRAPLAEVRRAISADAPAARDLRQNSPFAGMLSEPERRKIMQAVR